MANDISTKGTSMVVRQFCDLAFGWMPIHTPNQPWAVASIETQERYCLHCYGIRHFDVVKGKHGQVAAFCRCCGKEAV